MKTPKSQKLLMLLFFVAVAVFTVVKYGNQNNVVQNMNPDAEINLHIAAN